MPPSELTDEVGAEAGAGNGSDSVRCPLCGELYCISGLFLHIFVEHPAFLAVWSNINYPPESYFVDNSVINNDIEYYDNFANNIENRDDSEMNDYFTNVYNNISRYANTYNDADDDTYEDLSELCDRLGNVTVSMSEEEIDICAPIVDIELAKIQNVSTCAICLEKLVEQKIRQTAQCKHIFCSTCISTWFNIKRLCPLCRVDIR
ncbi:MAG: hypothetical protein EB127_27465, partial [Alphaproteobacteria bacterium]|nr:hypothetical protein [Alphaproteobacteria bacterium]